MDNWPHLQRLDNLNVVLAFPILFWHLPGPECVFQERALCTPITNRRFKVRRTCLGLVMLLAMSSAVQAGEQSTIDVTIRQKKDSADFIVLNNMLSTNTIKDLKVAIKDAKGIAASRITLWGLDGGLAGPGPDITAPPAPTWTKLSSSWILGDPLDPYMGGYFDGPAALFIYITVADPEPEPTPTPPSAVTPPAAGDTGSTTPYADVLESRINTFLQ
jgi:hypothetical protein